MNFKMSSTPQIVFGVNKIKLLPQIVAEFGHKALVVTGKSSFLKTFIAIDLFQDLDYLKIETKIVHVSEEPTPELIDNTVQQFRKWKPDVVLAVGGGSVIDAGKAISAMLNEEGSIKLYLEGIGTKLPSGKKTPLIAIPTTAGTGSEATKNAVITQPGVLGFKKSLRHDNYIPNIALVDPQLTAGCPSAITAASGMDAFTQLMESYLSTNANPMTDALALDGIKRIIQSIEKAYTNGSDLAARTDMSYAALISGITLANAGLGLVHGYAQPLGSLFKIPHGVVCGTLMAATNRLTVQRLREKEQSEALDKYYTIAQFITTNTNKTEAIDELLNFLDRLTHKFKLPLLSDFGVTPTDFDTIISKTGLKYHPIDLDDSDLALILEKRI